MLPEELSTIFRNKEKSYKMVLILSLIDQYDKNNLPLPFDIIVGRFLAYYKQESSRSNKVDLPPQGEATSWNSVTLGQAKQLIKSPIKALRMILEFDDDLQTLSFKPEIIAKLDENTIQELKEYALTELQAYNESLGSSEGRASFSLHDVLSEIMSTYLTAKTEMFAGHSLGTLFRQTIPENLRALPFIEDQYKIQGSIGQGNWANIPWIAIMDRRITETTQQGEYIVYLFSEDMNSVYLTLAQGVTVPTKERGRREGYQYLEDKAQEMRSILPLEGLQKDDQIHLTTSGLGKDYQVSTVAYVRYDRDILPDDEQLISDLENMVDNYKLYVDQTLNQNDQSKSTTPDPDEESAPLPSLPVPEQVEHIKAYIEQRGFHYPSGLIENLYLSLKTKPFVILAGVSGTGKTKLVKLFAEAIGATGANHQFTLIPVRPDWSDPSDLLGYKDLSGVFRPGRLAEVLVEASKPENQLKPYFICLDEMNLARVEYYFSDVLSVIETQEWSGGRIITSKLINRDSLGEGDQSVYGDLYIPDNVYLIGTVNMDETTHPFSKKVLDRANTIEFNYINLQQYPTASRQEQLKLAPVVVNNQFLRGEYLQLVDVYEEYTELVHMATERLVKINTILEEIHSHVGFRIRDSICFYMVYNKRFMLLNEDDAFDVQLLQKILPRVQGSSLSVKRVLLQLMQEAIDKRLVISDLLDDASELYQKKDDQEEMKVRYPQSARKIAFMLRRLEEDGFTSYWLS